MKRTLSMLTAGFAVLAFAPLAMAHPGHGIDGFGAGMSHPFLGMDHFLAMIAVGIWASQLRGRSLWMVPAAFVSVMTLGGLLGISGVWIPGVESGILASLVVLGLIIAMAVKPAPIACVGLVALFALLHGHAHGTELASGAAAFPYSAGFVMATAVLHLIGIGLGVLMQSVRKIPLAQISGAGIALAGVALWIGARIVNSFS